MMGPLWAQHEEVPHIRTFSGLVDPAFPYTLPEQVGISSVKLDWIANEILGWIANGELVGAELLMIKDEKTVFHEAYGWSDRERKIPVKRNSIWSIKSMTKPITAAAILMLVEEGKLSLNDPVKQFIPQFAGDERTTVHHLLCHMSGFHGNHGLGGGEGNFPSVREYVADWAIEGPTEPFGRFSYADFNYAALGLIVESVSNLTLDSFTRARILEPLGLKDMSTGFSSNPVWRARLNPWYRWNERAQHYDLRWTTKGNHWPFYVGSYGMFSTAMDYAKFMAFWLNGGHWKGKQLLRAETVQMALQPHADVEDSFAYGYGWNLDMVNKGSLSAFSHGGGDGTESGAFPGDNTIVVFLTHSRWGPWVEGFWNRVDMSGILDNRVSYGINGFMDWVSEQNLTEVEISTDSRSMCTGSYSVSEPDRVLSEWWPSWGEPEALYVWDEAGQLHLRAGKPGLRSGRRFHLVPLGDHDFALGRYDEGKLEAVQPDLKIRFHIENNLAQTVEVFKNDQIEFAAKRVHSKKPSE